MRNSFLFACALGGLAACSQKPAEPAANAAAAAPSAQAAAPAEPAAAAAAASGGSDQMPAPTAGRWQRVSSQDSAPPETSVQCMDGKPIDPTQGGPPCGSVTVSRTPTGGFRYNAICNGGGMSMILHMTGDGDFKTGFTTDATTGLSGGPGGATTTKNHSVYTYKGPTCPAAG